MMNPTLNKCIIIIAKLCNKHPNPKMSWSHLGHCKWCRPAIKSTQVRQHIVGLHIPSVEDRWGHSVHQAQSTKVLRECKQERFKTIVMQHDLYPKRICNTRQLAKLVLSNLPASAPAPLSAVNPWQTWHCSSRLSTFLAWNAEVFCPIFWWPSIKQSKFPNLNQNKFGNISKWMKMISKLKWETLAACSHCEQHPICRLGSSKNGSDGPGKWSSGLSDILPECHRPLKVQRRWTVDAPGILVASTH